MTTSSSSAPVSVASTGSASAAGGSVINVSSLVSQLVAATRAPQDTQIANETAAVTTKISALGTLKGALSTFQSSLSAVSTPAAFNSEAATSSDPARFTASVGNGAVNGNYSVTINNLASAQQLLSGPFVGGSSTPIGTGTLSIGLGTSSFNLTIGSTNNTVAGLAAAINGATGNPGVTAAVIQGSDGAHLLLSSSQTGAASTLTVTESDAGKGLAALTYGPANTTNYTQSAPAADASFSIAGVAYISPSNTVSDALSGVTFTLLGTTPKGTPASLTVATDTSTVTSNIHSFVTAYNTLQTALAGLGGYDAATGTAGPMLGDPLLQGVKGQIDKALYSQVGSSATYSSLASVGITTQKDGSLAVNSATLQSALSGNFAAVSQLFSSSNGVAAQLNSQIGTALATGGAVDSRSKTLTTQNVALTTQTNKLNDQMNALSASLTQQYTALNTLLSSLQTTSAYLTQAFAALPTVQGRPNA